MKKPNIRLFLVLPLLAFLFSFSTANAQALYAPLATEDFSLTVLNLTQPTPNTIEFDVYLLDTDASQPFEMASIQLGFLLNSGIYTGGTITAAFDNTNSDLETGQQFFSLPSINPNVTGYPGQTLIRQAGRAPLGAGLGTIISTSDFGTLITHYTFTSSVPFTANSTANLTFTSSTSPPPLYATRVAEYINSINVQLLVTAGVNATVCCNPVLNPEVTCVDPTVYNVTGGGSYCEGGVGVPVGLDGSQEGVDYAIVPGTLVVPGDGNAITFGNQLAGSYTVTATSDGTNTALCTDPVNMAGGADVTVTALPTADAGADLAACANDPDILLGGSPAGGVWSGVGVTGNMFDPSFGTQTLTYTVTNGCGSASDDMVVTVTALPTADAGLDLAACANDPDITLGGSPAGGVWSGVGVTGGVFDPSAGTQTLTYTVTNSCGSASDDMVVTVTAMPTADAGADLSACILDAPIDLVGLPAGGVWSGVGVTGNTFDPSVGTQTLTYTVTNTCGSASDDMVVTVTSSATANAGADLTACSDDADITLVGSPAGGVWSGVGVTSAGVFDPSAGTQTLTYSVTTGCGSASDDMTVTVNPSPVADAGADLAACSEDADITLVGSPAGGVWSGVGVTGDMFDPSAGTQTLTYTVTNSCGSASDDMVVTVTASPTADAGADLTANSDDPDITLVGSPAGGVWSGIGVTGNMFDPSFGTQTLTYTVNNSCGSASDDMTVTVTTVIPCPDFSTWNGSVSSDWFDAANWTPALLPCETSMVTIPAGCPNYPTIQPVKSAVPCAATINNLTIADGAELIGQQYLCVLNDAVVERTIQNSNFHLISSPVDAVTFGDVFLPAYWMEVWAREYNEPSGDWLNRFIGDNLWVGQGYSVQMTTAPQTATFTGMLNGYDVTRTLSNMNTSGDVNRVGWNLLGNPFTSAIDWDVFSTGAYDGSVAVWDQAGAGNYIYWNGTVGSLTDGIIPAQNGFFVKTATDGASLTIPMAAQTFTNHAFYKESVANSLELRADGNNYYDATFVHFNSNASADFDSQYDAFKLEGLETAPQLYNMAAGYNLSINELPFEGNEVVNLGFKCGVEGSYSLNASGMESFSSSTPILLEDLKLNILQDLRLNPVYSFNYVTNDNEARFKLHFKAATGISDPANNGIFVYSYERTVVINNTTGLNGEVSIFDMTGRELKDANMSSTSVTRIPVQAAVGNYIVKVTTAQGTVNQKVFIK